MSNNTTATPRFTGMGFIGWLTLLFIALKLTGYITWSWFWVLSPLIFFFGTILCGVIIMGALIFFLEDK